MSNPPLPGSETTLMREEIQRMSKTEHRRTRVYMAILFTLYCLWKGRVTAVVVTEVNGMLLMRISDYAEIHNIDPRTVIAAIAENRLEPRAFPVYAGGPPVHARDLEDHWLISNAAVIRPRLDGTGLVP